MSDTEIQGTALVVPTEDQPNEDAPITTPAPVSQDPPQPVEAAVAAHDAEVAGQTADGQPTAAVTTDGSPPAPVVPAGPTQRAKASDLEGDLRKVLDDYVEGKYILPEGGLATPHTLAAEIARRRGDGRDVSSGAVSAALARWQEIGFATLGAKPTQFIDYTDAARAHGLNALKQAHRANKSAAKKAVQEPAPAAATPTPVVAPASEAPVAEVAVVTDAPVNPAWEQGYPVGDAAVVTEVAAESAPASDGTPF